MIELFKCDGIYKEIDGANYQHFRIATIIYFMSRRTRTKMKRFPFQMGLNHHQEYSSTTTYFPQSYDILGNPIHMPSKIMPLFKEDNLNIVCNENTLMDQQK